MISSKPTRSNIITEQGSAVGGDGLRKIGQMITGVFKASVATGNSITLFEFRMADKFARHHLRGECGAPNVERIADLLV
jgi:hypothetical protein